MERILKYAPLAYAALVFIGFANLQSYYSAFGIQIWTYLSTGELLLSFLSIAGPLLWAGVLITMQGAGMFHQLWTDAHILGVIQGWNSANKERLREGIDKGRALKERAWLLGAGLMSLTFSYGLLVFLALWTVSLLGYLRDGELWIFDELFYVISAPFVSALLFLYVRNRSMHTKEKAVRIAHWIALGAFLMVLLCTQSRRDGERVISGAGFQPVTIITHRDTIVTNRVLVYAGKCNGAVFLYNKEKKAAVIVPAIDIRLMEVSKETEYYLPSIKFMNAHTDSLR